MKHYEVSSVGLWAMAAADRNPLPGLWTLFQGPALLRWRRRSVIPMRMCRWYL